MTEEEWLGCRNVLPMLEFLRGTVSDRKLRLFGCACCRQFCELREVGHFIQTVDTAERYADGLTSKVALKRARKEVRAARHALPSAGGQHTEWTAFWLAEVTATENAAGGVAAEIERLASQGLFPSDIRPFLLPILHCIFGNPFRPVTLDAAWQTANVVALAQAIYDERAFERTPILADALEEAGCSNADVLDHCRQPGEHVRGCWVVDLLLGKT